MAFELKQLTEKDVSKVCEGLMVWNGPYVKSYIERLVSENQCKLNSTWAVNVDNGNYIIVKPSIVRPETIKTDYYFYFNDTFYELNVKGVFDNYVDFEGDYPNNSAFKEELKEALFALGRYGKGSDDELSRIDAVFSKGG